MIIAFLLNALTCILGGWIGLKFADIDLAPVLPFRHRSAWTHGPLVTWVMVYLLSLFPSGHWFAVGFLLMNAVHLLADMFPRNWKGGAMVKWHPIQRELAPALSFLWLGLGAYISAREACQLLGWWI